MNPQLMIHVDAGRYRIFTNANRSGGVLCMTCPDDQGFILTDALNATLRWIQDHEVRYHPGPPAASAADPGTTQHIPRIPQQRLRPGPHPRQAPAAAPAPAAALAWTGREPEVFEPPPDYVQGHAIAAEHRTRFAS